MEKLIGKVTHYFNKIGVAVIEITDDELNVGDTIHIKGRTTDFQQVVHSMQIEHKPIEKAKKGESIGMKVDSVVHEKDLVYKVLPE
ncbi:MAG: translation elongation factor-like protein [candidate division WOR-3 bacterium]|nr:translation elongation factor-like protein [candidate division WOR-3 bacterium]